MSTITRMTIADYDRLIASGHFDSTGESPRSEFIHGELRPMTPIGPVHDWLMEALTDWSYRNASIHRATTRFQAALEISGLESVPEPDVLWLVKKDYLTVRPTSADVFLIVEIADSSLEYDCGEKASLYASGGVVDYWVVNIPDKCVEVFRQPEQGKYREHQVFKAGDEIQPLAFPEISLAVATLFPLKP
ncbi:MAG: Uma2 family endonuclease [Planctomycetes bacterium]|nr:Uma2 family endonuclease [Planctomycetota bacterium]